MVLSNGGRATPDRRGRGNQTMEGLGCQSEGSELSRHFGYYGFGAE